MKKCSSFSQNRKLVVIVVTGAYKNVKIFSHSFSKEYNEMVANKSFIFLFCEPMKKKLTEKLNHQSSYGYGWQQVTCYAFSEDKRYFLSKHGTALKMPSQMGRPFKVLVSCAY